MTRPRALVALTAVVVTIGACLSPVPPSVSPASSQSPAPSSPSDLPGSIAPTPPSPEPTPAPNAGQVTELAVPWMPPWSGPNAPEEITERAAHRFCGVEIGPGPVDPAIRVCFLAEIAEGRVIEFARIETTIEGDPIATIYAFEPVEPPAFSILTDSTQDAFGPHAWTVSWCGSMVKDPVDRFRFIECVDECVDGPTFR